MRLGKLSSCRPVWAGFSSIGEGRMLMKNLLRVFPHWGGTHPCLPLGRNAPLPVVGSVERIPTCNWFRQRFRSEWAVCRRILIRYRFRQRFRSESEVCRSESEVGGLALKVKSVVLVRRGACLTAHFRTVTVGGVAYVTRRSVWLMCGGIKVVRLSIVGSAVLRLYWGSSL